MHLINFTLLLFAGLAAAHPAPTRTTDPKATIAGCWNPVAPMNSSCVASDVPYCATHSPAGYYHHGLEECDWRTGSKVRKEEPLPSQRPAPKQRSKSADTHTRARDRRAARASATTSSRIPSATTRSATTRAASTAPARARACASATAASRRIAMARTTPPSGLWGSLVLRSWRAESLV